MFKKRGFIGLLSALIVLGFLTPAFAAEGKATAMWIYFGIAIACGFAIGVAALGTGLGMGNAIRAAMEGTARNPEAGGKIMTTMILGLALIESLCIYALLICLLMVFKIPALDAVGKFLAG